MRRLILATVFGLALSAPTLAHAQDCGYLCQAGRDPSCSLCGDSGTRPSTNWWQEFQRQQQLDDLQQRVRELERQRMWDELNGTRETRCGLFC